MAGLTDFEIAKVVNRYIGVHNGYLGDFFSHSTHHQFYPSYCELNIDTNQYEGTIRERFIDILRSQSPQNQAKILRGVIARFPVGECRTQSLHDEITDMIRKLEQSTQVELPLSQITSEVVKRAIADSQQLLQQSGATSAVDRIHTALHGYLQEVCELQRIQYEDEDTAARLLKLISQQHPAFGEIQVRRREIERILNSLGNIIDAISTIRNQASLAHPNEALLSEDEAKLVINSANTIIHYLAMKIG